MNDETHELELNDWVQPSDKMYLEWAKAWGLKPRRVIGIRIGMFKQSWYIVEGTLFPFQRHELDFVRESNALDKLVRRLRS